MKEDMKNLIRVLNDSLMSIDETVFEELVEDSAGVLHNGSKIIVSGLGKNVPVCEKFVGTMNSLGLEAYYMNTNNAVHGDIGLVQKGDLVIILTKSGETVESVYLNSLLKNRECIVWLLTFEKESTLTREIPKSLVISLEHEGDAWNIVPNNSTTLNLIVLQRLAMRLCQEMNISLEQFKKNHPGGHIGEVLKNV
ncbi:MAG: SIS domain-containing protein [Lachnospiraceae bacterium]|nr:SIS domain-containing protein [Lachnospiraceae bacterium]